jgi:hypothetical protein
MQDFVEEQLEVGLDWHLSEVLTKETATDVNFREGHAQTRCAQ